MKEGRGGCAKGGVAGWLSYFGSWEGWWGGDCAFLGPCAGIFWGVGVGSLCLG